MGEKVESMNSKFESEGHVAFEEETRNENEELISTLMFAKHSLESAEDRKDLEEIGAMLLFVAGETKKMESGDIKDKLVQALSIMTEKVESMDSEFSSKSIAVESENNFATK